MAVWVGLFRGGIRVARSEETRQGRGLGWTFPW